VNAVRILLYTFLFGCSFHPGVGSNGGDATGKQDSAPGHDSTIGGDAGPADAKVFLDAPAWPCGGSKPASPGDLHLQPNNAQFDITQISLAGAGQVVVVAPGANVALAMHWAMQDQRCASSCVDQLEVGFVDAANVGDRSGCVFDAGVSRNGTTTGSSSAFGLTAPTTPGAYELRLAVGQNFGCTFNGANNWWAGQPPPTANAIVKVCVH
jgi:hypothetical protein